MEELGEAIFNLRWALSRAGPPLGDPNQWMTWERSPFNWVRVHFPEAPLRVRAEADQDFILTTRPLPEPPGGGRWVHQLRLPLADPPEPG